MARPANMTKLTLAGSLNSGQEQWATSFWLTGYTAADWNTNTGINLIEASAAYRAFRTAVLACLKSTDQTLTLTGYFYPTPTGPATLRQQAASSAVGSGASVNPLTTCAVLTLRTGNIGRRYRGRMYVPFTGGTLTAGAALPTTPLTNLCTTLAAWYTNLNGGGVVPVVLSETATAATPVIRVDSDLRPDVQRRRSDKQAVGTRVGANV